MSRSLGVPVPISTEATGRLLARVARTSTCWIWMGAVSSPDGYGRFYLRDGERSRSVTPQRYLYEQRFGPLARSTTLMHQCEVRICCRVDQAHVIAGTQTRNMRDAAWRGRARGSRPGLVDVRGPVGQARAIQHAMRANADSSSSVLALVLADVIAAGNPLRNNLALFDPLRPDVTAAGRDLFSDPVE